MTNKNERISRRVYELMRACGIVKYPVNIKALITSPYFRDNNIEFDTYENLEAYKKGASKPFGSEDGVIVVYPFDCLRIIYYKAAVKPKERVNWTIAHEIGHNELGHREKTDTEEQEADTFAKLLLCHPLVLSAKGVTKALDIAAYCGISKAAAKNREADIAAARHVYNEWDYAIRDMFG